MLLCFLGFGWDFDLFLDWDVLENLRGGCCGGELGEIVVGLGSVEHLLDLGVVELAVFAADDLDHLLVGFFKDDDSL